MLFNIDNISNYEDYDLNPTIVKIKKKTKFNNLEESKDWKKTRKTKRWQWHGNRSSIRNMNNEF